MENIIYIGQFKDASGYGNAARGYLYLLDKFLNKEKYNLKTISLNFEKQDFRNNKDINLIEKYELNDWQKFSNNNKYTVIVHGLPNYCSIDLVNSLLNNKNCLLKINLVAWETDNLPIHWKKIYNSNIYNRIGVFSKWNQKIFSDHTSLPVYLIPHAIYDFYNLEKSFNNKTFNIFSMSQWSHRKGFDILLKAYYQEFFNNTDVELFIKTYRNETLAGSSETSEKDKIIQDITKIKNSITHYGQLPNCKVSLKTGVVDNEEIKSYYDKATVFCSPTRGEGFGMTIAQAALSGIPCVVPSLGGHIDYLNPDTTYWVDCSFEPLYELPYSIYSSCDMNFVEPSLSSTRKQLRKAYNDWKSEKLLNIATESRKYSLSFLDEQKIFKNFMEIL